MSQPDQTSPCLLPLNGRPSDLISVTEAARLCGVSRNWMSKKLRRFQVWTDHTTGRRYVSKADVLGRFVRVESSPRPRLRPGPRSQSAAQRRKVQAGAEAARLLGLTPLAPDPPETPS